MPLPRYLFRSLRFRLLASSIAIVVLLFLATLWNTERALRQVSADDMRVSIRQTAETLNLAVVPYTTRQGLPTIADYFRELVDGTDTPITYLALLDENQHVILRTPGTPDPLPDPDQPIEQQIASGVVHVSQPILVYESTVGSLRYGLSTAHANAARNRVITQNVLVLCAALALVVGTIVYFGLRINRRITRLVQASSALAGGDFSARSQVRGHDELALLSGVFDQMAQSMQERNAELEQRVAARTADLQEMISGLESFNRSVSHDLRGPLGGITGLAQMATQALERGDDSVARRVLPQIAKQSELSTTMLTSLLTLARVGDATLHRQPVALGQLVQEALDQLALADPSRPQPEVVVHDLPTVQADPDLLRPVLLNLIGNAIKFTAQSPAPRIEIGAHHEAADHTTVYVRDNGPGFDLATASRLFEPFVRLHAAQFEGHGVGLSIVRRAIGRHGGQAWALAHPGQGACFYFTLPDTPPTAPG